MKYNFDEYIKRTNTNSVKYDIQHPKAKNENLKRLWIADMDFQAPKEIKDAIKNIGEHNIYGYSRPQNSYFEAVISWMEEKHQYHIEKEWFLITPGIVFAIGMAIRAFTKENDGVLIQEPVYYPFKSIIQKNGRIVVDNPLVLKDNYYQIDFMDFEEKIRKNNVKLFVLCNPHNPVGRVWKKDELMQMAEICKRYGVIIVSDEIHADFAWTGHKHLMLTDLDLSYQEFTITCTAPSKTFNIAGLQISNIFIPNEKLRFQMKKELAKTGYSNPSQTGIAACEAGYRYGNEWYEQLKSYLEENFRFLKTFLEDNMPNVNFIQPEATYLAWVDCKALGFGENQLQEKIITQSGLWLEEGKKFGSGGEFFERFNIACPRQELKEALELFQKVLTE